MKKYLIVIMLLVIYLIYKNNSYIYIPTESIRFRIIPSSNNVEDIFIKEKVLEKITPEFSGYETENIETARKVIGSKVNEIETKVEEVFNKYEYKKDYKVKFGLNYFPEKKYNGVVYEEGYYESLVVELGEAKGDNFWCVLFPPLCLLEVEESEKDKVEYTFAIKEIINKIFKK